MFADRKPRFGRMPPYHRGWSAVSWAAQRRRVAAADRTVSRMVALQVTDANGGVVRSWLIRGSWQALDAAVPVLQSMWPELACTLIVRGPEPPASGVCIPVPDGMLRLLSDLTTVLGIHDDPPASSTRRAVGRMLWIWLLAALLLAAVELGFVFLAHP